MAKMTQKRREAHRRMGRWTELLTASGKASPKTLKMKTIISEQ